MRSRTILFVDDEPWGHESLRFALESQGFDCINATDITSAVRILRAHPISVVVTDIMMPGGPDYPNVDSQEAGFHFVQIVKQNWPDVRVVCLSVIGDQVKIRGLKRHKVLYLCKGEVPLATAIKVISGVAGGKYSY